MQGTDYLEKIASPSGGEILQFAAHAAAAGWLLDREDVVIDGQKYTSHYTFNVQNRIRQQQVDYENDAACGHVISMIADYTYTGDALTSVTIKGGYDGYVVEGSPKVEWQAAIAYSYDAQSRVSKEDLAVTSLAKTYTMYPLMRVRRPIENVSRMGDLCATSGTLLVGNAIDLRPFYALSSDLAVQLPFGVTRAAVTLTYPDSFRLKQ